MKKTLILLTAMLSFTVCAKDETKVTYVGDGRYTCSGSNAQCAQVESNNRLREQQRQIESDRRQYDYERRQDQQRYEKENRYESR